MIVLDGDMFRAPADASYADLLVKHCWRKDARGYYTREVDYVLPLIQYLDPVLQDLLLSTDSAYSVSLSLEPTGEYDIPVPEGEKLFGYQLADAEFIIKHRNTLLAEEAGTGKSAIITAAANHLRPRKILIICPAIAKYNWVFKEWPRWTTNPTMTIAMADGDFYPDTDVVVINYDILDRHKKRLQEETWDYVVCDESHRLKNPEAKRTVMVFGGRLKMSPAKAELSGGVAHSTRKGIYLFDPIPYEKRVFASATSMNRPRDLWTMVRECDPTGLGRDKLEYEKRYCAARMTPFGWDNGGAAHLEELGGRLRASFMVRHDPAQILDLPPLREELFLLPPVKLEMDAQRALIEDNLDTLLDFAEKTGKKKIKRTSSPEDFLLMIGEAVLDNVRLIGEPKFAPLFQEFSKIRKETGVAKVPFVVDFINEVSEDLSYPIVVFAYHREVIMALRDSFDNPAVIMGGLSATKRGEAVNAFQDLQRNPFLGNIDAAGEAVTLTSANILAFAEFDWRGTAMMQARKRIHRIAQNKPCAAYYLAAAQSFDAIMADSVFLRMEQIKETLDI